MPVYGNWNSEEHLAHFDFVGHWTWDEFFLLLRQHEAQPTVGNGIYDVILNDTRSVVVSVSLPKGRMAMQHMLPNGCVVLVTHNPLSRAVFTALAQIFRPRGIRMAVVGSVPEARAWVIANRLPPCPDKRGVVATNQ